jgi:fibronectin-binding autotransporter adhesin
VNSGRITKFDANGNTVNSDFANGTANVLNSPTTTQSLTYQGGQDASANSVLGSVTLRGANETGAGGATSAGGGAELAGGTNAATNAASQGGVVELLPGASTGATQGLQGLLVQNVVYVKGGGTSTQWNLQCLVAAMTVNDCAATPETWLGVAEVVGSNTVQVTELSSEIPINASAAVTLGHTVCAGSTAGKVTDSGGTATCTNANGSQVGIVVATAGTWTLPDGTSFTASTTLPLIHMNTAVRVNTAGGGSGTVNSGTAGQMAYYASSTNAVSGNANANISNGALTLGVANTTLGNLILEGNTSGALTITPQAVAGTPTWTAGTSSGTPVVTASGPLVITAATGNIACATCATSAAALTSNQAVNGSGSQGEATGFTDTAGTITSGRIACYTASNTVGNCTALGSTLGVFNSSTTWIASGETSITLDATVSVTFGDNICQSPTVQSEGHDNGTTACTTGLGIGIVKTTAASVSSATIFVALR